ncbi:uncharacterized protein V2V93DRAFT_376519 [Kockiozyma suomiensis]|uniref:uncharacterized protein n=1 Tax=Kockiozyma suomiensis TaxID=1337062 RepID=UPI0033432CB0
MSRRAEIERQIVKLERELSSLPPDQDHAVNAELSLTEYTRYGRQMLVRELGKRGQILLRKSSVLVVGAGGLGCPALLYLSGAGIGKLGIVDHDVVSLSNLPRQTLYSVSAIGMLKVDAAISELRRRNSEIEYVAYPFALTSDEALRVVDGYDVVLDCTDTPMSRYLLGDVTRILNIPLISASALRTEAQLLVLNRSQYASTGPGDAPCYRCVFPTPPSHVDACSDAGILGPVVGTAGLLQALEAIKIIAAAAHPELYGATPGMLLFNSMSDRPFRTIRTRRRQSSCKTCGDNPSITKRTFNEYNYTEFCHISETYPVVTSDTITVSELESVFKNAESDQYYLIDVRDSTQFEICSLANSIHIPLHIFLSEKLTGEQIAMLKDERMNYIICRYGNDSRTAVKWITENLGATQTYNVTGGLAAWSRKIDPEFPEY